MTSMRRSFGECVFRRYGYYANFLPVNRVSIGDFGIIEDGAFTREGSLADRFGLSPDIEEESEEMPTYEFNVGCEYAGAAGISGVASVPGVSGSAGAQFSFSRRNGIFFSAAGCRTQGLRSLASLKDNMIALFAEKRWKPEWVAVTEVVRSSAMTLIVGEEAGAGIELRAKADGPISFTDISVAGSIEIISRRHIGTTIIGAKATPFVKIGAIRRKSLIFGGAKVVSHGLAESPKDLAVLRDRLNREGAPVEEAVEFRELGREDGFRR
ncbi:hypothetical protein ACU8NU_26265 (plasmid) [Rhizobium leguminosarum]